MHSPSLSLSTLSPAASSPSASPCFSCKASELLEALKAADLLRKSSDFCYGLLGASVFFSDTGAGVSVEAFQNCSFNALSVWLPSGFCRGSFSLPLLPLLSFVKATKGKGEITYKEGKLSSSASSSCLVLPFGLSLYDHPDQNEHWRKEGYCLSSLQEACLPDSAKGFALLPFLTASKLCSSDESKQALMGAGFSGEAFTATDGFCLRKLPAFLPALPKASGGFPEEAWLPAWLAPVVEVLAKPKERPELLAFYFPAKREAQALRFRTKAGLSIVLRFPAVPGSFPHTDQLFPSSFSSFFVADTEAFLAAVESLLQALKASDGEPRIELCCDNPGEILLSADLQKNVGSKKKPELETVGRQEASFRTSCLEAELPSDPRFDDGFFELPASQQEMAIAKHKHESRLLVNGLFLQKLLKSFLGEGDRLRFSWNDSRSPIMLSAFTSESKALLMPIQRR